MLFPRLFFSERTKNGLSVLLLVWGWFLLSNSYPSNILPSPQDVFFQLFLFLRDGVFFDHFKVTFVSVLASFSTSLILGVFLGFVSQYSNMIGILIRTILNFAIYLPSVVVLYLVIIIWGVGNSAVFIAVLIALTPEMGTIFSKAVMGVEGKFREVIFIYRIPKISYFFKIVVPQLSPTILGMAKLNLAVSWKLVLVAEVFAQSKGIGYKIFESFSVFSVKKVLAWLIGTILIFVLLELLAFKPIELFIQKRLGFKKDD